MAPSIAPRDNNGGTTGSGQGTLRGSHVRWTGSVDHSYSCSLKKSRDPSRRVPIDVLLQVSIECSWDDTGTPTAADANSSMLF